ncbi:Flp family type IVb pilin [Breoghania sp. L-A4]|uniref:Flp family type IVb pilin n=1 Tax=Breoghania sp. L-A4 TaxID=2304600 RepID=UPI000E35A553|nr:Flp family type IVb pilin [Breoghania sp. L-A4]AXS42042.1 Flp family type IVb pilin [Breoghania sp. L-A4]
MALRTGKTNKTAFGHLAATFLRDERGSTAIEYGLIAAILTIALIGSLITLRESVTESLYNPTISNAFVSSQPAE